MKNLLALAFSLLPFFAFCQAVDTAAVTKQVDSLIQVCRTLTGQAKYDDGLQVIETAKKKAEGVFGVESAGYASCVFNQGRVFYFMGNHAGAEPLYLEAKAIREKVLGKEHPDYAASLNNLANIYQAKGEYDKALPLHLEAKAIREKVLGKEHQDYAGSLNNLANVYWSQGEYDKALPFYLESKVFWEKVGGKEHPNYATCLYNLGNVYRAKGECDKAVPVHLEAKSIREKVLGEEHPDYAAILNTLGLDYSDKGEYDKALPLYLEAKVIWEKALGKEHPLYVTSLNNLAILYWAKGEYDKALSLHLETKAIQEKVLGKEHSDYASILNNLASVYRDKREYDKALPLYMEAKVIWERVLGKGHSNYATSLNNLANVYWAKGEYDKALPLYLEAKAIQEKVLGKEHPLYALSLTNLAGLYKDIGEYHKALPLYLEGRAIQEKVLGKQHPDYANSLYNLASTYRDKGDRIEAASYFLSSNTIAKSLLQKSAAYSSEKEMLQYQALFQKRFDALLSFTQTYLSDSLIFAAFDNALFLHNAQVFNASAREKSITQADSSTLSIHAEWKSCHFQLAKQYALPIADRDSARVARLEEQANEYEKELARHSPDFVESQRVLRWQEVRDRLRADEAAIEFVHYRYYDQNATDSTIYAALVLRPGDNAPHWVTLFEEGQLRTLLGNPQAGKADFINQLYDSTALYELVWKPLERWLDGATRIYYAPSGLLHRLSPDAFQYAEKQVLAEHYALHRLGSTRQLVTENPTSAFAVGDAVIYGGVRYEMDSVAIAAANQAWIFEENAEPGGFSELRGGGGNAWGYLKWTEIEAKSVAELLAAAGARVEIRQGYTATEESFAFLGKRSAAPKVLHLATHAFFFPAPVSVSSKQLAVGGEPVFIMSEHPMMRSGLVLAGVNHAWAGGKPLRGMEDGILTAYEISQMNLSGTELVVLSACETGLGDIQVNEGVYGLQRAFKIAGAKYLVMSLWQVPDYETEALMTAFYTEWLTGKKSIPEAFRSAQRQVRTEHPEPFNWAGFVLVE